VVARSPSLTSLQVLGIWAPHTAALIAPLLALGYLLSAPHAPWLAVLWFVIPGTAIQLADRYSGRKTGSPHPDIPAWPFDILLAVLVAVQFANIALLLRVVAAQGLWSLDSLGAILLVGGSSGYSGIVVAHELIHRESPRLQWVGRAILCTVLYEHFYTEHLRGHHLRVATPEDPATARFGETFNHFYFRTVPAQFKSAWQLETKRLGDESMRLDDRRVLRNRVLHGLVAQAALLFAIGVTCGVSALAAFVLQAVFASRALEVVNYFEHWGLIRAERRVRPVDSWDCDSRFTYYALTGLTRHADHHAYASRPYQALRPQPDAPMLPRGYIALFPLVIGRNATFRRLATEELQRRRLGPFAEIAEPEQAAREVRA